MNKLLIWLAELRAEFYTAPAMSVVVVAGLLKFEGRPINWINLLLTLLAAILVNAGTNTANDYWDHITSDDEYNTTYIRPFTGGSRFIQKGLLPAKGVLVFSFILFGFAALIGAYLTYVSGWPTLAIGAFGILTGYFYTAKPVALGSRGFGELIAGLDCGVLVALATYYIQTGTISWIPVIVTLPLSFLVSLILYVNEFPDAAADEKSGKVHMVVRLGFEKASKIHGWVLFLPHLALAIAIALGTVPVWGLLSFATLPILIMTHVQLRKNLSDVTKLTPTSAGTVASQFLTGLLLTIGLIIS